MAGRTRKEIYDDLRFDLKLSEFAGEFKSHTAKREPTFDKILEVMNLVRNGEDNLISHQINLLTAFPTHAKNHGVPELAIKFYEEKTIPTLNEARRLPDKAVELAAAARLLKKIEQERLLRERIATLRCDLRSLTQRFHEGDDFIRIRQVFPQLDAQFKRLLAGDNDFTRDQIDSLVCMPDMVRAHEIGKSMKSPLLRDYEDTTEKGIKRQMLTIRDMLYTPKEIDLAQRLDEFWQKHGEKLERLFDPHKSNPGPQMKALEQLLASARVLNANYDKSDWAKYETDKATLHAVLVGAAGAVDPNSVDHYKQIAEGAPILSLVLHNYPTNTSSGYQLVLNAETDYSSSQIKQRMQEALKAVRAAGKGNGITYNI